MSQQPPLFVETIYDALRAIVAQQLGGPKTVGARLWPGKSVDDARMLLLNCLNPDRHEKLDPEQVVLLFRLAREADFHIAKHWLDAETGYEASAPLNLETAEARQLDVLEHAAHELQRALSQLERIRAERASIKPLRPVA